MKYVAAITQVNFWLNWREEKVEEAGQLLSDKWIKTAIENSGRKKRHTHTNTHRGAAVQLITQS